MIIARYPTITHGISKPLNSAIHNVPGTNCWEQSMVYFFFFWLLEEVDSVDVELKGVATCFNRNTLSSSWSFSFCRLTNCNSWASFKDIDCGLGSFVGGSHDGKSSLSMCRLDSWLNVLSYFVGNDSFLVVSCRGIVEL